MQNLAPLAVLRTRIGAAVAVTATLFLAPLLAFSETTIKGIMDRWLSQCVVVLAVSSDATGAALVRVHTFGEMPEALPVTVTARDAVITRITLLNHVEQATAEGDPNLLVHPLANQRCPGDLCPDHPIAAERLTVRIRPATPNYLFQLRVLTLPVAKPEDIAAYSRPLQGERLTCRVERATTANYIARQPKEMQIALLSLGVLVMTLVLGALRQKPKEVAHESQPSRRTLRRSDRHVR
ncbi:MAG: hypothetical protein HZC37_30780 [Burkholderiales bacterium]|nr:hypothetical protein [Burkholderiales bacterium]